MLTVPESGKYAFIPELSRYVCVESFIYKAQEEIRQIKLTGLTRVVDPVVQNPINHLEIYPDLWPQRSCLQPFSKIHQG